MDSQDRLHDSNKVKTIRADACSSKQQQDEDCRLHVVGQQNLFIRVTKITMSFFFHPCWKKTLHIQHFVLTFTPISNFPLLF